jgi:3-oxoadipyl-CoA thiolase
MPEAFICDYARTPFGRYGGTLKDVRADDLAAHPLRALRERHATVDWEALDDCVLGCANQAGEDNRNVARMAVLLAGFPVAVPGATVNRLCGSGLDAVGSAARAIRAGEAELMLAGGVESMTRAPFVQPKQAQAFGRAAELYDTTLGWRLVNPALHAAYGTDAMGVTAETVAEQFGILRKDQDAYARRSQVRAGVAAGKEFFAREIVPIAVPDRPATRLVEHDEPPRPDTTLEALAALPTPFRAGGTVTAGNAAGLNDGAAALLLASEAAARRHGLVPRARVVSMAVAGVAPRIMGVGPAPAVAKLLARHGLLLSQIDLIELNEAFAAQVLAVTRMLGLADDAAQVNPHGGAIALGHPLGASGARLAMTCVNALTLWGEKRAVATMCIGVGQGIALLIERV